MNKNILVTTAFFLTACATGGVNVADPNFTKDFSAGNVRLTCTLACAGTAGANRSKLTQLYTQGNWSDLAREVARVGYENEREYFYLGIAAQQLGYKSAAKTYYNLALTTQYKCKIQGCDGFVFPRDIQTQLSALEPQSKYPKNNPQQAKNKNAVLPVTSQKPIVGTYILKKSDAAFAGSCFKILGTSRAYSNDPNYNYAAGIAMKQYNDLIQTRYLPIRSGTPERIQSNADAREGIHREIRVFNDEDVSVLMNDARICMAAIK